MRRSALLLFFLTLTYLVSQAQTATLQGVVTDSAQGFPLEGVNVVLEGSTEGTYTGNNGHYTLQVESKKKLVLIFSYVGKAIIVQVNPLADSETRTINARIQTTYLSGTVTINIERGRYSPNIISIRPKEMERFSSPTGGIENMLKTLPGVSGNNELSSGFNVRGGNYDENLIYVNDIEIYRPQLIRSGQQEGQSFINTDLVENISFSAGGFQAKYGDKMSSVLDVKYREPDSFATGVHLSLLGASAFVEDKVGARFRYTLGARYRTNAYLFGSLDVQGNYKPRFLDLQTVLTYEINSKTQLSFLGSIAQNQFQFVPESQVTSFGTVTEALQLSVFFNGGELMRYTTSTNALTLKYALSKHFQIRIIGSSLYSNEREFYTVEGAYRLDELDKDLGSSTFGQAKFNRGAGYFINHARNELEVQMYTGGAKAAYYKGIWNLNYGVEYRHEAIWDVLNEWVYNDSVDYSVPVNGQDSLFLFSTIRSKNTLLSNRYSAYIQQNWELNKEKAMVLNTGIRAQYWDMNGQTVVSPRFQFSFEPNKAYNDQKDLPDSSKKRDILVKASFGVYNQPPFYREMRDLAGNVNTSLLAQRAIHYVLGSDFYFRMWQRPFKFSGEMYFKQLDFLDPYLYENVRIRYYANNAAKGYAAGIDTRVNGEFVKGLESWFSLSVMQTKEKITYTNTAGEQITTNYLRRPTDQRVNLGVFFQDELEKWPEYKVSLNLVVGTGMPYFLTGDFRYTDQFKIPPYRRLDIGFSRDIISADRPSTKKFAKHVDEAWISLDVFNVLGVQNVASYIWIRDVTGTTFAVPNYLTSRRINLNFVVKF